ncbi:MAG: hypothetical protein Q7I92_03600, partial [Humidesulfovibrio sp.]|nr:hypothetical protein [Humidesulfovibrio sp.]
MSGELAFLSIEEVLTHFRNYQANYLLDRDVAVCYMNRFLIGANDEAAPCARQPLEYLLGKCLQLAPFDRFHVRSKAFLDDPVARVKIEILDKTNFEAETFRMIEGL